MTPEAKRALSMTIRSLRARLLDDLHAATETAYRLAVRVRDAGLDEAARTRRARLETWVAEQLRAQSATETKAKNALTGEDFRREAEKQAAYTLLNRLVILRLMEAPGPNGEPLRAPAVVTGGWPISRWGRNATTCRNPAGSASWPSPRPWASSSSSAWTSSWGSFPRSIRRYRR